MNTLYMKAATTIGQVVIGTAIGLAAVKLTDKVFAEMSRRKAKKLRAAGKHHEAVPHTMAAEAFEKGFGLSVLPIFRKEEA